MERLNTPGSVLQRIRAIRVVFLFIICFMFYLNENIIVHSSEYDQYRNAMRIATKIFLYGVVMWLIWSITYWPRKGVKQILIINIFKRYSIADVVNFLYTSFPNKRYNGFYVSEKPYLVVRDPAIIRQITVKDFDYFTDHVAILPEDYEPLWTRNIFSLKGENWRDMRATLSPAFTSKKMRSMFSLMSDCAEEFTRHFHEQSQSETLTNEMKDVFTRFTNDVIATCAFGIKCDSLKDRENEFYMMAKESSDLDGYWTTFKHCIFAVSSILTQLLGFKLYSKNVTDFFTRLVGETVKAREEQNIVRPDMINLLMEARKGQLTYNEQITDIQETTFATVEESDIGKVSKPPKAIITDDDITAQALLFLFGGFESVATLMCFMAYELAINPDIQEKLRADIDEINQQFGGKLTYEAVNQMKYFDLIISETLRKWPTAPGIDRVCVKPYLIPSDDPNKPPLQLSVGDNIFVPIWGLHYDEKYYPDPEKFDPERFSDENKHNIQPYTYLPFGVGPRNCIGMRFALLETKTVFFHLLTKFEIVPVEKTPIPMKLSKKGLTLVAEGGFWLGFKPRE